MESEFDIELHLESYLASLHALFEKKGEVLLSRIVVNAECKVKVGWDYNNWNGGTYGHAIILSVPREIYLDIVDDIDNIQDSLRDFFNQIYNRSNEHIAHILVELIVEGDDSNWRKETGLLINRSTGKSITNRDINRIWGSGSLRLFISHKAEDKLIATDIKKELKKYGVDSFVAHEDIEPTYEWMLEIENALFSMHAFLLILKDDFYDSIWTNQEIGVAYSLGVKIIPLKINKDPRGFVERYQACSFIKKDISVTAINIMKVLLEDNRTKEATKLSIIISLRNSEQWRETKEISQLFEYIDSLDENLEKMMVDAFNQNSQVSNCTAVSGIDMFGNSRSASNDIVKYMKKWTGKDYAIIRKDKNNVLGLDTGPGWDVPF